MTNLLTGQIDLNLIQSKIGVGIDQLTAFMQGQGVEAITNWIHSRIIINGVGVFIVLLVWLAFLFFVKRLLKDNERYEIEIPVIFLGVLLIILLVIILAFCLPAMLSRRLAPEITFIQYFM